LNTIALAILIVLFPPSLALTRLVWVLGTAATPASTSRPSKQEEEVFLIPDFIQAIIDAESEEWARGDLRADALQLFDLFEDWERVQRELIRRHQRPDPRATDEAWAVSAQSLAEAAA
jgi:hypothetical protein